MSTSTRSPNYPAVSLERAIELTKALWSKEKRSEVPASVAVQAWGYKSLSGAVRPLVGALRKYGLVDGKQGSIRVSDLGIRLIQYPVGSDEYQRAIREAALNPELFREIFNTHREGSDDNLRAYLIHKRGFAEPGAKQVIKAFRETVAFAKLDDSAYSQAQEPDIMPASAASGRTAQPAESDPANYRFENQNPDGSAKSGILSLTVPYAKGNIAVQIRVTGEPLSARHLAHVRQYLKLTEGAMIEWPEGELPDQRAGEDD